MPRKKNGRSPTKLRNNRTNNLSLLKTRSSQRSEQAASPAKLKPISDFIKFVQNQRNCCKGRDISDNERIFVAPDVLYEYWSPARIGAVQHAFNPPLSLDITTIRERYLRTFSTLVLANRVEQLNEFTSHKLDDYRLPLTSHPTEWHSVDLLKRLFSQLNEHQWTFFPLVFDPGELEDRELDDRRTLPIQSMEEISHGDAAAIYKIKLYDGGCNKLVKKDTRSSQKQRTFILKSYYHSRSQQTYENEIRALRSLRNSPSPNVITFYGSFRQHRSYNLILEYAELGSLSDYFKKQIPPKKPDQVAQFWKSFCEILKGLESVHSLMFAVDDKRVHGIHEDIKPENILLSRGRSQSPYDFVVKIADFGLFSHVRDSNAPSSDAMGADKHGNQLYSEIGNHFPYVRDLTEAKLGSPECSYPILSRQGGPNMINTRADIFSLGAVLSDTCAWIHGGREAQNRYLAQRKEYHARLEGFHGSGFEGCFHDGHKRLSVVDEMHDQIREQCRDPITPRILDIIEQHMLLDDVNHRLNAREIAVKLGQIMGNTKGQCGASHTRANNDSMDSTQSDEERPNGTRRPTLAQLSERLSVQRFVSEYESKGSDEGFKADVEPFMRALHANVPDRDHFFFVDDSTSMDAHRDDVRKLLLTLIYLTEQLDPNKVELAFASNVQKKIYRTNRRKRLLARLEKHAFRREPQMMENCFSRLIDSTIIPWLPLRFYGINFNPFARKPTSIYIFTDGNWGTGDTAGGVERPIKRLIDELSRRHFEKNQVTLHFIRFGNSETGKENLSYLDSLGTTEDWDIVDVKPATGSLYKFIVGPLSRENDDEDEDD